MSDPASDAEADAAYAKGVAAIKSGAMDEAIELLAKALELKTAVHGEEAVACAPAYYKYGCALFYKAQDENTVFGKQAQAQADAKDEAAKKAAAGSEEDAEDVEEEEGGEDPDAAAAAAGEAPDSSDGAAAGGEEEEEEEEEDDMELAWKLIENARLIYEEDGEHPIELANCFETLGEINTEHSNFKEALEDLERCLAILEMELEEDDRRIAGVLCSMSVAHQMLDEYDKALKGCTRAIGVCASRVKRLKSSDENAVAAVAASWPANAPPPEDPLAAAKAELEQIEAVLGDLTAREEELKGLVSEDNSTREQIKKAFAAIGGASAAAAAAAAGGDAAPAESAGFDAPKLSGAVQAAPVKNLGVVGKSAGAARVTPSAVTTAEPRMAAKKITVAPGSAPAAPAGSSAAAAAAAFAQMSGAGAPSDAANARGAEPAAKKAKIAPVAAAGATDGAPAEKENAPDGCKQQ